MSETPRSESGGAPVPEGERPREPGAAPERAADAGTPAEGPTVEEIALLRTDEIKEALARAKERDVFLDRLQRLQAEFDNFRKRVARERESWRRDALRDCLLDVLQVVDNVERALCHDTGPEGHADFVRGIVLLDRQLRDVLGRWNVRPIEAKGAPFDPSLHEAVTVVPAGDVDPGTVVEELTKGYRMDDAVLRPTRVCVARAPAGPAEEEPGAAREES